MTEKAEALDPRAYQAVGLAIAAAGPIGEDQRGWRRRVHSALLDCAAMLRDGSAAAESADKVINAHGFPATYMGHEFEESSKRIIVHTRSKFAVKNTPGKVGHNPEGDESQRTERTDTLAGWLMKQRIERELKPGTEIYVYKNTETISAEQKVRVLVHFDILRAPARQGSPPRDPSPGEEGRAAGTTTQREARAEDSAPPPEPHSPADNKALAEIEQRTSKLSASQMVAFGRLCKANGVLAFMAPEPADLERVLGWLTQIEGSNAAE